MNYIKSVVWMQSRLKPIKFYSICNPRVHKRKRQTQCKTGLFLICSMRKIYSSSFLQSLINLFFCGIARMCSACYILIGYFLYFVTIILYKIDFQNFLSWGKLQAATESRSYNTNFKILNMSRVYLGLF